MKTESNKTLSGYRLFVLFASLAYILGCFMFPEAFCLVWLKAFPMVVVFCCMLVEFFKEIFRK